MLEYVAAKNPFWIWTREDLAADSPEDAHRFTEATRAVVLHSGNGDGAAVIGTTAELIDRFASIITLLRRTAPAPILDGEIIDRHLALPPPRNLKDKPVSSYLLPRIHIDALISAAHAWALIGDDTNTAGLILWRENATAAENEQPAGYTYRALPGRPRPAQVLRWADTYAYQASAAPAFAAGDSPAAQLINRIRDHAARLAIEAWPAPARPAAGDDYAFAAVRRSHDYTSARHTLGEQARNTFTW